MGDGNLGYSATLIGTGLVMYGNDQPNLFYIIQIAGKLVGVNIPNAAETPSFIKALAILLVIVGLLIGIFHFFGPKIKPIKQLVTLLSYQPISSKQIVLKIKEKEDCWVAPLNIDLTKLNHRSNEGQKKSVSRVLRKLKKLKRNRELYHCGVCHIPYVMLAGFYLRNFKLHFLEIDHYSKSPKLLYDQPSDTSLQLNVKQDIASFTEEIGLLISISYLIDNDTVTNVIGNRSGTLHLASSIQGLSILNSESDIERFAKIIRTHLDRFVGNTAVKTVHLFYSGPMSLAFRVGQLISENTDPKIISYNWEGGAGYRWAISLNKGLPHVP